MHTLTKLLLLGASATVILAQQVIPQIKFCKEKDLGGECYTQPLEAEKCVLIPDSNATGDKGSSYTIFGAPTDVICGLFRDNECKQLISPSLMHMADKPHGCSHRDGVCKISANGSIFRSYRCIPHQFEDE